VPAAEPAAAEPAAADEAPAPKRRNRKAAPKANES
jgi:hypothetical protein